MEAVLASNSGITPYLTRFAEFVQLSDINASKFLGHRPGQKHRVVFKSFHQYEPPPRHL